MVLLSKARAVAGVERLGGMAAAVVREVWDALYPPACFLCGAAARDEIACEAHVLPRGPDGPRCGVCAAALAPAIAHGERCPRCRERRPRYVRLEVLFDYRASAAGREWLLAFKHGGRRDLARPLAAQLARRLSDERVIEPGAALVPVPLHRWRRLERGYDQAALLAEELAQRLGGRNVRTLARTRATAVQGAPGSPSRAENVAGAFVGRPESLHALGGRSVWLVDDVVTSGSTLEECALALKRLGVRQVCALALARASPSGSGA